LGLGAGRGIRLNTFESLCGGELGDRRRPVLEVIDVDDLALFEGEDVDGSSCDNSGF